MVPASGSVAVTAWTAVWFSATLTAAGDVIVGDSFTFVTEIVTSFSVKRPSESVALIRGRNELLVS